MVLRKGQGMCTREFLHGEGALKPWAQTARGRTGEKQEDAALGSTDSGGLEGGGRSEKVAKANKTDVTPQNMHNVVTKVTENLGKLHHTSCRAVMTGLSFPWTLMRSCTTWARALGPVSSAEIQWALGASLLLGWMNGWMQWSRLQFSGPAEGGADKMVGAGC